MGDAFDGQDWKPVVIRGKQNVNNTTQNTGKKYVQSKETKLEQQIDNDEYVAPKPVFEIKIAIMRARTAKKMAQSELAKKLNIKPNLINEYESGKTVPDNSTIAKIERILGTKLPRNKK